MATIKSYTDIEQSRKLAEILPLESADMNYWLAWSGGVSEEERNTPKVGTPNKDAIKTYWCSCWSLASLLGVLPEIQGGKPIIALDDNYITYPHMSDLHTKADNLVDACVAMIIKLSELKML